MSRKQLAILILVISVLDGFLIGAIVSTTASPAVGIPLGAAAMALPWIILCIAGPLVWQMLGLHQVERQFPLRDPAVFGKDARIVSMCSRSSWLAANNCIEVATDDDALHIRMAIPGISPKRGVSIPWETITTVEPGRMMTRFQIPGHPPMWLPKGILAREYDLRQISLTSEPDPGSMLP